MQPDCIVVGGGVMGLSCAVRLADAGLRVTVLERGAPGGEASSAAAGMLSPQAEAEEYTPTVAFGLAARRRWPAFARELAERTGIDVGYRATGVLWLALGPEDDERLARRLAWQRQVGLAVEELTPEEIARREPALVRCRAGLGLPDDHQVDPVRLCRALAQAAARAGVQVRAGARVSALLAHGGRATGVRVQGETLATGAVVLAAGAWSADLPGSRLAPGAVVPVRGQIARLAPRPAPIRHVVFSARGYLVPGADGDLLAGSTMEHAGYAREVTAGGLADVLGTARLLVPALGESPVVATWAGLRPVTGDGAPILGRGGWEGMVVATGSGRKGILHAPAVADGVRDLVLGRAADFDPGAFSPARPGVAAVA
jgi:glycine oxidase